MTATDIQKLAVYGTFVERFLSQGRPVEDVPARINELSNAGKIDRDFSGLSVEEFEEILAKIEFDRQMAIVREIMEEDKEVLRKLAE